MATEVVMPQMGESIAEGTITKWLVKPGDRVERDQPLFEISTDKVDAEIPSPVAGVLKEIKAQEGDTVPVDEVVALVDEDGAEGGEAAEEKAEPEPEPAEEEAAEEKKAEKAEAEEKEEAAEPEAAAEEEGEEEAEEEPAPESEEERLQRYSSPLVRKIAQEEGVDLADVEGTGVHGRVTKKDILAYVEEREEEPEKPEKPAKPAAPERPAAAAPPRAAAAPGEGFHVPAYSEGESVEIEPMSKIRQITAAHMRYSKDTSAHVTTVFHVDFSRVARVRARAKGKFAEANDTKLTYMPFIFKSLAAALKKHKKVNAAIDGTDVVFKQDVNIGMAVDVEGRGLLVPVIRDADELSLVGLAKTANDLAERARNKKLGPDELKGGTFTVTNPGVFGSLFGTPIINQPQVAILGVGAIEKRPVVITDANGNDALSIRTMCYLSITYDHRLVDGADADRFMIDVKKMIEEDSWAELDTYM